MTWLNYHHLLYFYEIVREGTVAKAAAKLKVGQPALSMQLRQFEDALGFALFERSKRNLQITEAGRVAYQYADEIFRLGEEMTMTLRNQRHDDAVDVVIGVIDSVPKHLAVKICEHAQQKFRCHLSILEGQSDFLTRELKSHRIDLLVSNYAPTISHGLELYGRCVAKMPVIIAGAETFAPLRENFPQSLVEQPLILPTSHSRLRSDLEHFFKLQQIRPKVTIEAQDTSMMKLFAKHGAGMIAVAEPAIEDMLETGELLALGTLPDIHEELWLIAWERRIQNPVVADLVKEFKL